MTLCSNFKWAERIEFSSAFPRMRQLQKELVFQQGLPLVLTNSTWFSYPISFLLHMPSFFTFIAMEGWDRELFSWSWLRNNSGKTELINSPRNVDTLQDETGWRLEDYLDYLEKPKPGQKASRLYGKVRPRISAEF